MDTIIIKSDYKKDIITIIHKKKLIPLPKQNTFKSSLELIHYTINKNEK